jgi:pyrroline-5-carboxylate reductase
MLRIMTDRLGFVGAGNMAAALVRGWLGSGNLRPSQIKLSDVDVSKRDRCAADAKVGVAVTNRELAEWSSVLILAVKPQAMAKALAECAPVVDATKLVISIAAGVRTETIAAALPNGARIVRTMPNTPALVGAAATALAAGPGATAADLTFAKTLFDAVGRSTIVDESLMDAVTGLSGSGPAYVMVVIEALADGGVREGLSRETALLLATQTVLGSARLLIESGDHPAEWKDRVTSPGGTTSAGLAALEAGRLRHALARAVQHATRRARELGNLTNKR